MDKMVGNRLGLAGELRVMSELLLRNHNPAKSYLEEGADLILENGLRLEVKSSHRRENRAYFFTLLGGRRNQSPSLTNCDFLILWCMEDDCFFIVPVNVINRKGITITNISEENRRYPGKYIPYKNKWELLDL